MKTKRILCITDSTSGGPELPAALSEWCDIVTVEHAQVAQALADEPFDGFFILNRQHDLPGQFWHLLRASAIFDQMTDGFAVVDRDSQIIWTNRRLAKWFDKQPLVGQDFFAALGNPAVQGDSANPLASAARSKQPRTATLKFNRRKFFRVTAAPMISGDAEPSHLLVTLSDVSREIVHLQKLEAIHNAGAELADLTPEEVYRMNIQERIELLKANILYYTQDLLEYDVVEIRLIDRKTNRCEPLLSEGIDSDDSKRPLYAESKGNGVTGYVCATGQSYLCEDITRDPLYVHGLIGARSSLTVPLVLHDQVIGSFNVESPETNAFRESDLQLLQIFARDIARALNTLELLVAEKTNAAHASIEAIQNAVGLPIDEILNDTVHLIENYTGQDANTSRRLRKILKNSREIRGVIHNARESTTSSEALPESMKRDQHPLLRNRRILVIDAEDDVRNSAHLLLEPLGCIVETAHEGSEAIMMVRNCDPDAAYDAIIADIRLPDYTGYQILMKLKETMSNPPLILMTGFGYDPGHSIVKARQAGLRAGAVLYKPFKLNQLVETLERTVQQNQELATESVSRERGVSSDAGNGHSGTGRAASRQTG